MVEQKMRIIQLNTADIGGGAEKIAWDLFNKYRERGNGSWLVVGEKHILDPDVLTLPNQEKRGRWYHFFRGLASYYQKGELGIRRETLVSRFLGGLAEPLRRVEYHLGIEDFHYPGSRALIDLLTNRADILHAHNLHGAYFDLRLLPALSRQIPFVVTLHDAWLLSGHCAHFFLCERWKIGCGNCPDLSIYPAVQRDETHYNWLRKKDIYAHSKLYVATPSRWLMSKVEQSILAQAILDSRVVPNGIDLNIFHPAEQGEARIKLGLRPDLLVLLAVGVHINDRVWKDYRTFRQVAINLSERLKGQNILILALGEDAPEERFGSVEIHFISFQKDPAVVARYYQAADVYMHPAHIDTFPTCILEALACGIPVVATAVGGIPEQIIDSQTGFLTPPSDAELMTDRIIQLILDPNLKSGMGASAAKYARQKYNLESQVDIYLDWYEEIVDRTKCERKN